MTGAIRRAAAALSLVAALLVLGPALGQEQSKPAEFDPAQETAIRKIVRDYLVGHPEVVIEAIQIYQQQQKVAAEQRKRDALKTQQAALFQNPHDPIIGNPDGDVSIVEFFDYRCGYCRSVANKLRDEAKADGRIRLVMKEFPILGPDSQFAARAALASVKQGLYEPFHFAMMNARGNLDNKAVMAIAGEVGLDVQRLKRDMGAREIDGLLRRNFELAEVLGINGTPAFVIGDEVIPGAIDMQTLQDKVAKVRSKSS
jgi:protein-disulfide isomerase